MSSPDDWSNGFVAERPLRILQVSTWDIAGGAETVAWNLFQAYRERGYGSWLAVGRKKSDDADVLCVPNDAYRSLWARGFLPMRHALCACDGHLPGMGYLQRVLQWMAEPYRQWNLRRGMEDFHFPGIRRLLNLSPQVPHVVHCHNLHGGYFDLGVLPWLSQQVPVVLTLHDAWLLSGHCAHSFGCERWKTGCGQCRDLTIYPTIRRDATAYNWQRKQRIFAKSRLYVATPSRWLMQKVEQSMLAPAVGEARVIHNGVDLSVFHPADRRAVRAVLGMPPDATVLLFTANRIRRNIWKDYQTMRTAVALIAERLHRQRVLFIALGEDAPAERIGQAEIRFVSYQKDPEVVARYYQAADVYLHAARADTFPNTVLEALACGTPAVATAVGGIPEQIEQGQTGFLVPPSDAEAMAEAVIALLTDERLHKCLGANACRDAQRRFDLKRQVNDYIGWYGEILENRQRR